MIQEDPNLRQRKVWTSKITVWKNTVWKIKILKLLVNGHSFQKIHHILWSTDALWRSRDTDTVQIWKCDLYFYFYQKITFVTFFIFSTFFIFFIVYSFKLYLSKLYYSELYLCKDYPASTSSKRCAFNSSPTRCACVNYCYQDERSWICWK